jgi:pSer/pThr/pTyr-binding forkhead associated (FHA) protein
VEDFPSDTAVAYDQRVSRSVPVLQSPTELQAYLHAERAGVPFVVFRDDEERQRIIGLPESSRELAVGRGSGKDIHLAWDKEVSRVHALLSRIGGTWTVVDDGLSRNGTFVNGDRVLGRHRLCDRDVVRCGTVSLQFREPAATDSEETITAAEAASARMMSPAQRRVLVALCRPLAQSPHGLPATNKEIAFELSLSVDAVKTHLRRLAELLEVEDLPQNQKRAQLAWDALSNGLVSPRELPTA